MFLERTLMDLRMLAQVVGDRKGAVFGSLVEAPLRPNNKRKYQVGIHEFPCLKFSPT